MSAPIDAHRPSVTHGRADAAPGSRSLSRIRMMIAPASWLSHDASSL